MHCRVTGRLVSGIIVIRVDMCNMLCNLLLLFQMLIDICQVILPSILFVSMYGNTSSLKSPISCPCLIGSISWKRREECLLIVKKQRFQRPFCVNNYIHHQQKRHPRLGKMNLLHRINILNIQPLLPFPSLNCNPSPCSHIWIDRVPWILWNLQQFTTFFHHCNNQEKEGQWL